MNVQGRLVSFAAVLGLAFGGAALAGAAIDSTGSTDSTDGEPAADHSGGSPSHGSGGGNSAPGAGSSQAPGGLAVAEGGVALEVDRSTFGSGETAPLTFRITDRQGRALREGFQVEHERELHLIVVRRDTSVFRHLHPDRADDGTWSVELDLGAPGAYRAFADFTIGGVRRTLGSDLFVPGDFQPVPYPAPDATALPVDAGDGGAATDLGVTLAAPGLVAGSSTSLDFSVTQGGRPFEGLEPYLGAKGHLVALREGDLAYLHVHPTEDAGEPANQIAFAATFPTAGRYRLFLQYKTGGEIRTVSSTLEVPR